jgi:NAD(P)-dependent dehydrogenase (short-subunit alcohol dehydrogenase family)
MERHGGIDSVIQNGAYMPRAGVPAAEDARPMIETNSHGTLRVLRAMLPILRPNGRIVVVASGLGVLSNLPEPLRTRFDTRAGDPDRINLAMDAYVDAVERGAAKQEGWPEWVNIPSKVGQVAVTRAFATRAKDSGALPPGALINIANPGLTWTDATRDFMGTAFDPEQAQTPQEAAEPIAWLATLPPGTAEPYGELVQGCRVIPFGD